MDRSSKRTDGLTGGRTDDSRWGTGLEGRREGERPEEKEESERESQVSNKEEYEYENHKKEISRRRKEG